MTEKSLTLALMDPPYESANSTTALRITSDRCTSVLRATNRFPRRRHAHYYMDGSSPFFRSCSCGKRF